jgi:uncharacterized protein (TIGR03435 family)
MPKMSCRNVFSNCCGPPVLLREIAKGGAKFPRASPGNDPEIRGRGGHLIAKRVIAELLSRILANELERPVLNRTGIDRAFDVELDYTPDQNPEPGASLFTVIQEQPGLKLESQPAPVDVLIVDRIEHPSPN